MKAKMKWNDLELFVRKLRNKRAEIIVTINSKKYIICL